MLSNHARRQRTAKRRQGERQCFTHSINVHCATSRAPQGTKMKEGQYLCRGPDSFAPGTSARGRTLDGRSNLMTRAQTANKPGPGRPRRLSRSQRPHTSRLCRQQGGRPTSAAYPWRLAAFRGRPVNGCRSQSTTPRQGMSSQAAALGSLQRRHSREKSRSP